MSHRKLWVLMVVLFLAFGPQAHAQWAVVDVGAIAQLVQQVNTLRQQLQTAQSQLTQAQTQFQSMTGRRGAQVESDLVVEWVAFVERVASLVAMGMLLVE